MRPRRVVYMQETERDVPPWRKAELTFDVPRDFMPSTLLRGCPETQVEDVHFFVPVGERRTIRVRVANGSNVPRRLNVTLLGPEAAPDLTESAEVEWLLRTFELRADASAALEAALSVLRHDPAVQRFVAASLQCADDTFRLLTKQPRPPARRNGKDLH